jgi:hypothetical protein
MGHQGYDLQLTRYNGRSRRVSRSPTSSHFHRSVCAISSASARRLRATHYQLKNHQGWRRRRRRWLCESPLELPLMFPSFGSSCSAAFDPAFAKDGMTGRLRMTGVMKTALRRTSLRVVSANSRGLSIAFQILLQRVPSRLFWQPLREVTVADNKWRQLVVFCLRFGVCCQASENYSFPEAKRYGLRRHCDQDKFLPTLWRLTPASGTPGRWSGKSSPNTIDEAVSHLRR